MKPEMITSPGLQLTASASKILDTVGKWRLSKISARLRDRLEWSADYCDVIECEYRKFIFLTALNPEKQYGMAGPVDEFWHEHLLDTRDYCSMCTSVAGCYIHHIPRELDLNIADGDAYADTVADLHRFFGCAPSNAWPESDSKCGGSPGRGCASCKSIGDMRI